jgi:predicted metalloprotease with PDZ domain
VKGLLAGFIFDASIIDATDGRKTLDDVMRLLFKEHKLPQPGYGEDDLRLAINEVAGKDLSDLYTKMIRSTDEMPYRLLSRIGLTVIPNESSSGKPILQQNPAATPHAQAMFQVWLHRLNGVEQ